ncbi:MAG: hypothetical protein HY077_08355 [Elusimicrobia bacterium]|nr:hypothetical protein [Elusimicrobiota bacterium]
MEAAKRLSWAVLALLLGSQAWAKDEPKPVPRRLSALQNDIAKPENFDRFVDGSPVLRAGAASPVSSVSAPTRETAPLGAPAFGARRPVAAPVPAAQADGAPAKSPRPAGWPGPASAGAALGLGLALVALSLRGSTVKESTPLARPAAVPVRAPQAPAAPPLGSEARPRLEVPEPFLDTRMPVPTWRAITQGEQGLIEDWGASAQKARGESSLEDWIDAHAAARGVDAAALKAKLLRDA